MALEPTVREGEESTSEKSAGMNSAICRNPKSEARSLNSAWDGWNVGRRGCGGGAGGSFFESLALNRSMIDCSLKHSFFSTCRKKLRIALAWLEMLPENHCVQKLIGLLGLPTIASCNASSSG